jgi:hypothetical protein
MCVADTTQSERSAVRAAVAGAAMQDADSSVWCQKTTQGLDAASGLIRGCSRYLYAPRQYGFPTGS